MLGTVRLRPERSDEPAIICIDGHYTVCILPALDIKSIFSDVANLFGLGTSKKCVGSSREKNHNKNVLSYFYYHR